jgi:hypothetical protein
MSKNKLLVSYVFHIYNERVQHFFNYCIFNSPNVDFLIICNDKNIIFENKLPPFQNVSVFKRDNIGVDFGGWSDGILTNDLYKNYTHFIFCNSSIIGPFLNPNFRKRWTDVFIDGLRTCKLFGSTINTVQSPHMLSHVQSYIFSMNLETLEYLIEEDIFTMKSYSSSLNDAIFFKEIGMSRKILTKGWNIGCLLPMYKNADFTMRTQSENTKYMYHYNDVMYKQHMNVLWNPYDLVFIKGNRIPIFPIPRHLMPRKNIAPTHNKNAIINTNWKRK